MTKEELIKILEKKGFERNLWITDKNKSILDYRLWNKDYYINGGFCVLLHDIECEFIEICVEIAKKDYLSVVDHTIIIDEFLYAKNLTEQKIDEILSQCIKIKTSLYQIEQIIEELK